MKIELLTQNMICVEYEKYAQWPSFKVIGSQRLGGLWRTHFLRHILSAEDLHCAAWRSTIPTEILKLLQRFPESHAESIEMAQAVPEAFVRWANWSSAFTLIAATYWRYRGLAKVPDISARKDVWENLDPADLLQYSRCDPSKSFQKTLAKIPPGQSYEFVITRIRDQWQSPEKRRLLRHLKTITIETTWLLGCYPPILDPAIHRLAAEQPEHQEFSINAIICDIVTRREMNGCEPWPYSNRIHSWDQLLRAYDKFLRKIHHVPERFRSPPVAAVEDDAFLIEPLQSRTALEAEGAEMSNCIASYLAKIHSGNCYAYRLFRPERATVLIDRRAGRWSIAEAMIAGNERQVRSSTWNRLSKWVMTAEN